MAEYSEATKRVLERALENLKGKLDDERIDALRALVSEGKLADLTAVEEVLRPREGSDGDR
jgi:hypothetical protein